MNLTWHNNVSKAKHREFVFNAPHVSREHDFDRCIKRLGDRDHDLRAKHPENVVKEQACQHDHARDKAVKKHDLHRGHSKADANDIVGNPVLG